MELATEPCPAWPRWRCHTTRERVCADAPAGQGSNSRANPGPCSHWHVGMELQHAKEASFLRVHAHTRRSCMGVATRRRGDDRTTAPQPLYDYGVGSRWPSVRLMTCRRAPGGLSVVVRRATDLCSASSPCQSRRSANVKSSQLCCSPVDHSDSPLQEPRAGMGRARSSSCSSCGRAGGSAELLTSHVQVRYRMLRDFELHAASSAWHAARMVSS